MDSKNLLQTLKKNLLATILGALSGIIIFDTILLALYYKYAIKTAGHELLAYLPVFIFFFSIAGIIAGSIIGIILINIIKNNRQNKEQETKNKN